MTQYKHICSTNKHNVTDRVNDIVNTAIATLFPREVVTEEALSVGVGYPLYPEEEELTRTMAPKRQAEFRLGRHCTRMALRRLFVHDYPILIGDDRVPIWPEGIVGSISHTDGYCGVAVACRSEVPSIGFDVELIRNIDSNVWRLVCTQMELQWIALLSQYEQPRHQCLLFSAKESVYKCQYMVTKRRLNFRDVQITLDTDTGTFQAMFLADAGATFPAGYSLTGSYLFGSKHVFTGVTLRSRAVVDT